ncbi:hypothetical protein ACLK1S_23020 [Escherichia coli]
MKHHRTDKCATDGNDTAVTLAQTVKSITVDGMVYMKVKYWQTKGVHFRLRVANDGDPKAPLIQAITKGYLHGRLTPYTAGR